MRRESKTLIDILRCVAAVGFIFMLSITATEADVDGTTHVAASELTQPGVHPISAQHADEMRAGIGLFKSSVRQLLEQQCLRCHQAGSNFDFASRRSFLAGSIKRNLLTSDRFLNALRLTAPHSNLGIEKEQLDQIRNWLDLGFPYDRPLAASNRADSKRTVTDHDRDFWSFRRLKPVSVPTVDDTENWCRTDVDRFILAKLEAAGIKPNSKATPRLLVRRAYFDLIGLPPKPSVLQQFDLDEPPVAFGELVDQLLASGHYGERWAEHWLATVAFQVDENAIATDPNNADQYLDYLIYAFNTDQPFDEFTRWQVAGDRLAPLEPRATHATAFLGSGVMPPAADAQHLEQARYDAIDEVVTNTARVFLGLSVGCARCHDHLTDPITTGDYYRLTANFRDIAVPSGLDPVEAAELPIYQLARGDLDQKQQLASPGYLTVLTPVDSQQEKTGHHQDTVTRASFANWMLDEESGAGHLAARVIVNRIWESHFGRGLVASPDNFGRTGKRPTHPELLDYLANELIRGGWKLKPIHRLIMNSAVYQQSSRFDRVRSRVDRANRLHWRREPRMLEPSVVRDAMLSMSGLLEERVFGASVGDNAMAQRSIYVAIRESNLVPLLMVFDRSPKSTDGSISARGKDREIDHYAKAFAQQLKLRVRHNGKEHEFSDAIAYGYQAAFGRAPTRREAMSAKALLERRLSRDQANSPTEALEEFCRDLLNSNEFNYVP